MNASPDSIEFRRNVIKPVECLKAGHELVRSQYWLFVGIIAVGMIIAGVVPLGILMLAFHQRNLFPAHVLGAELHLVSLLFVLSGSLMISKTLRIPKL